MNTSSTPPADRPASPPPKPPRMVPCPSCKQPALFSPDNPYRPFCSERCRNHDLGAWANEAYRVAAPPRPEEQE
jgi:uncharacterized protein